MTVAADTKRQLFSVADMLAAASAETGLSDFGDAEFHEALTRLVDSTNTESTLSPMGAMVFPADVHRLLVNRLRLAEDFKRHPEILDEDVSDPIIILGMPRTGTTKLQRLLSADPDVQRLDYWRLLNFAPFPNAIKGEPEPRIEAARQALDMMAKLMPGWMESHPMAADEVDEDIFIQLATFKCVFTYMARPVPSYRTWFDTQSMLGTYQYLKKQLQYLQWQDGGKRGRPWILKSPAHLGVADIVLEVFPKATLVFTHRDMQEIVPSHCKLQESSWRLFCEEVDMKALGQAALKDFAGEMRKHVKLRERMGDKLDVLDVRYETIKNDAMSVIREVYRRSGRELTPQREAAILEWERTHPARKEGSYSYNLADYGLTRDDIEQEFQEYSARFLR